MKGKAQLNRYVLMRTIIAQIVFREKWRESVSAVSDDANITKQHETVDISSN